MKLKSFKIGDSAELSHKITKEDLDRFVDLTGDDNPLHVDADYAGTTSFKQPVVHGMLGASFISTIIGTKLPGKGALWFSQTLDFLLPVRIGDELTVRAEVISINERQEYLELKTEVLNQKKQKVITGTSKVKVVESEKKDQSKFQEHHEHITLILGATGDVGNALARKLMEAGHRLIFHYVRNEEAVKALVTEAKKKKCQSMVVKADLANDNDVREMMSQIDSKFGYLTGIVNCATPGMDRLKFEDTEWKDFEKELSIHVQGTYSVIRYALPLLKKGGISKVVNLSTLAIEQPASNMVTYITAKAALHGLTKALAFELSPHGIRFNLVSPGFLDSNLNADIPEKARMLTAAKSPTRSLVSIKEVVAAIEFLLSPGSDSMTGETIRLNGGQFML